ncbi:hypothetical protein ACFQU7_32255 [Pseudoroseomonas wenyumeiae]
MPLLDEAGEIREWFGAASDVTARKQAEEALQDEKERFRLLVMSMPQLVWRSADGGAWTWSSPQWGPIRARPRGEPGAGLARRRASRRPRDDVAGMAAGALHGRLELEFRIRRGNDGTWRWHQTRALPMWDLSLPEHPESRIREWVGTSTDIENLMRLQQQQQILVAELQHRTRNLLTVIRSILNRSLPRSPSGTSWMGAWAPSGGCRASSPARRPGRCR